MFRLGILLTGLLRSHPMAFPQIVALGKVNSYITHASRRRARIGFAPISPNNTGSIIKFYGRLVNKKFPDRLYLLTQEEKIAKK